MQFTEGMKKYKAAMKKKLSRPKKDKNGVEEISIKPNRVLHSNEADECWALDEKAAPKPEKKSKKSKSSVTKLQELNAGRSGSAGSGSSADACVVDLTEVDDGIETIYDADHDEISS